MDIQRLCPFTADAFFWQPALGEHRLTLCVKATFALIHGRTAEIAPSQIPLHEDVPWEAQHPSSLYAPSDYVPKKQRIDIFVAGHAYAPMGTPQSSLTARLQVGTFTKSLRIIGDRTWTPTASGLQPSSPRPFISMPLRYERAIFGPGNPIGIDTSPNTALAGRPLPNIQLLDELGASQGIPGFGPMPAAARARKLRMSDASIKWAKSFRTELNPPAIDFDFAFFNAAPPDQQADSLPEPLDIVLEHLHPSIPQLSCRIPAIGPKAFRVSPKTGLSYAIPLLLDTLLIDSDRALAVLTFRGTISVAAASEQALGKLVVAAGAGTEIPPENSTPESTGARDSALPSSPKPLEQPPPSKMAAPPHRMGGTIPLPPAPSEARPKAGPNTRIGESTITLRENPIDSSKNSNVLPKSWTVPLPPTPPGPPASSPPGSAASNLRQLQTSSIVNKRDAGEAGSTTLDSSINSIGFNRALPFLSPPPPSSPAPPPSSPRFPQKSIDPDEIGSTTLAAPAPAAQHANILPFGKPLGAPPPALESKQPSTQPAAHTAEISGTLPLGMRSPNQLSSGLPFQSRGETPSKPAMLGAPPAEAPRSSQPGYSPPPPAFAPPPRSSQPGYSPPPPSFAAPPPAAPISGPPMLGSPPPKASPNAITLEQCALIAAELGARFSPRTEILRKHRLDEATFGEAERQWMNAIAAESEAGKSDLLDIFDDRYVQSLEQLRGEITIEMYAQLMVGSERGNLRPVLSELKLQRPAVLRIERVWKRRLSRDPKLALAAADAIAQERKK